MNEVTKTVVITGGTSGIGRASALRLAKNRHRVVITSRDKIKVNEAAKELSAISGGEVIGYDVSLSDPRSVNGLANRLKSEFDEIDVLVNNAGTIAGRERRMVAGVEYTLASNYIGPFALTVSLLPQLMKSGEPRIVNLSSELYKNVKGGLDFENLNFETGYSNSKAYAHSKLAMMLFTKELINRYQKSGVSSFALHPGVVKSNFGRGKDSSTSMGLMMKLLGPLLMKPEKAAIGLANLVEADLSDLDKSWYWNQTSASEPTREANDSATAAKLWERTEELARSIGYKI